ARRRLHAAAPEHSAGRDGEPVADGSAFDGQGDRGCRHVPDRRRDGYGSHPVRRWRRAFRPLVMERSFVMTVFQHVAICFTAGVVGALAVVLFSHVLFALGLSAKLGVKEPVPLKSPDIYRPLFWGGLWGIPFGLLIDVAWPHLYLFGLLY